MSAKLDITKPLRLIGIQIFENTLNNVRKALEPGWYPFIKCKQDIGSAKNLYPEVSDDGCPQDYYRINEDLPRISISAIVGKNGSGKSSLLDILYRIINNFAENTFLMKGVNETNEIGHAQGISGRLHFEQDGVQKFIECNDYSTNYYEIIDGQPKKIQIHELTEKQRDAILNGFFYTISVNYSLYAFNPSDFYSKPTIGTDYNDGDWLNYLFHKNDGYYIPLVLTPFRDNGQIDINNENSLAQQRFEILSLMFHSQGKEFLDEYQPIYYKYRFNPQYKELKQQKLLEKPIRNEIKDGQDLLIAQIEELWKKFLFDRWGIKLNQNMSKRDEITLYYLAYKTLKICSTYPHYKEISDWDSLMKMQEPKMMIDRNGNNRPVINKDGSKEMHIKGNNILLWYKDHIQHLLEIIKDIAGNPHSHITLKIHQCLNYLTQHKYLKDEDCLDVDVDLLQNKKYETYDDMMKYLAPSFFTTEVVYRRIDTKRTNKKDNSQEITLRSMSSGEKQMLYSLSYIFYHIKNIASIKSENGKRIVGYHHINLIFDEAELYYHPEYQRQYIRKLLEHLAMCHINRTNIRSINIIIVTHSPFILSDLPETNILFLDKNQKYTNKKQGATLGANIYELLKNGFFLEYAIGDFIQMKLREILDLYYEENIDKQQRIFLEKKDSIKFTIDHLGEEYIRNNFNQIYIQLEQRIYHKSQEEQIMDKIRYHEEQINSLKDKLEKKK